MTQTKSPLICVIDDEPELNRGLCESLESFGYRASSYSSASALLESGVLDHDLIISDIHMPGLSGYDLCKSLRKKDAQKGLRTPIILITGGEPASERATGLEAGADEFLQKPFRMRELRAKVESLLRIREQEAQTLDHVNHLSRFLSPNIVHLMTKENRHLLAPHRAQVTVLFVDLRRFTSFAEKFGPETVLSVLNRYYAAVGGAAMRYGGTLGHLAGDGIMVFFNDPKVMSNHCEIAVRMALETRAALETLRTQWNERNYDIDFGIGLSDGEATIGCFGFENFSHYSVIGPVANFGSRLCAVADNGQILISARFRRRVLNCGFKILSVGEFNIKGIEKPVSVFSVQN